MECKFDFYINHYEYLFDIKVEPYWNVNLLIHALDNHTLAIKVEPYWNVNFSMHLSHIISFFN